MKAFNYRFVASTSIFFFLCLALLTVLGCGKENISHPNVEGEWLLKTYREGSEQEKKVAGPADQFSAKFTASEVELWDATGHSVWGGPRKYSWEDGKIRIDGVEDANSQVLWTSSKTIGLAQFHEWKWATFERVTDSNRHKINRVSLSPEQAKQMEFIHAQLKGVWECTTSAYPGAVLMVEIGEKRIRAQAWKGIGMVGVKIDLIGGSKEPGTYALQDAQRGKVFCPDKKRAYDLQVQFHSPNEVTIRLISEIQNKPKTDVITMHRRTPQRLEQFAKQYRIKVHRLNEDTGVLTQTSGAPKP